MLGNSKQVVTNQDGLHPRLAEHVKRHLSTPWRGPIAEHTQQAFAEIAAWIQQSLMANAPLILDTGCGTGRSSVYLAEKYPQHLVIGIDQSEDRLRRSRIRFPQLPHNLYLARAEAADLWRLMAAAGWRLEKHFVLYPNPWPKAAHLGRRWHGHPAWRELLLLKGELVCRSNWRLYLDEMQAALAVSGIEAQVTPLHIDVAEAEQAITDFEEKYALSQHSLWQLTAQL